MKPDWDTIEMLLEKPCYIVDYLPKQVPEQSGGQFFAVENYLLNEYRTFGLDRRFAAVLLKLMCYYETIMEWEGFHKPSPEKVLCAVRELMENHSGTLHLLFPEKDAMAVVEWDSLSMGIYGPDEEMQELLEEIAGSEGLFFRRSPWGEDKA